jgi:hypothetical protein
LLINWIWNERMENGRMGEMGMGEKRMNNEPMYLE